MVTPLAFEKYSNRWKIVSTVSGDITTAAALPVSELGVDGTWFNMRDYMGGILQLMLAVRTDNVEGLSIYVATSSAGANAAALVTHSGTTGADAAGDSLVLEFSTEQMVQEGADAGVNYTHVSAYVETGNSSDRVTVTWFMEPKFQRNGLTADYSA